MLNKCGLFVISLLISIGISSVVFSDVSKAASPYDGAIQTVNTLTISQTSLSCTPVDYTYNFIDIIKDQKPYVDDVVVGGNSVRTKMDAFYDNITANFDDGAGWIVLQQGQNIILGYFDPTANFSFSTSDGTQWLNFDKPIYTHQFYMNNEGGPCSIKFANLGSGGMNPTMQYSIPLSYAKYFLLVTDNITYPTGYEGEQIPKATVPPIQPAFTHSSDNFDIFLTLNFDTSELSEEAQCYYQIANNEMGDNFTEYYVDCNETGTYKHTFTTYGNKSVILVVSDGGNTYSTANTVIELSGNYPEAAKPYFDYSVDDKHIVLTNKSDMNFFKNASDCFFRVSDTPEGDSFTEYHFDCSQEVPVSVNVPEYGNRIVALDIILAGEVYSSENRVLKIDGSSYSGTTLPDPTQMVYESCALTDIMCHMRNAGRFIQTLFIPSAQSIQLLFTDLKSFFMQKLGFLSYTVDWFIDIFSIMLNLTENTCQPTVHGVPFQNINGTFFGTHVNLNPCSAEQDFPQIYGIAVFFIRVVTIFGLLWALYQNFYALFGKTESNNYDSKGNWR